MLPLFSGWANFAGSIIKLWMVLEERREKRLDREHQRELQKARHDHELLLQRRKTEELADEPDVPNISSAFLERLRVEAAFLSLMGFEIVYEPISDGYGLALSVREDLTLAFWVPTSYPDQAPHVYMRTYWEIQKISFEPGAWEADHTIAELVSVLTVEEENV